MLPAVPRRPAVSASRQPPPAPHRQRCALPTGLCPRFVPHLPRPTPRRPPACQEPLRGLIGPARPSARRLHPLPPSLMRGGRGLRTCLRQRLAPGPKATAPLPPLPWWHLRCHGTAWAHICGRARDPHRSSHRVHGGLRPRRASAALPSTPHASCVACGSGVRPARPPRLRRLIRRNERWYRSGDSGKDPRTRQRDQVKPTASLDEQFIKKCKPAATVRERSHS